MTQREFKFRAKRIDTGEWVQGYYVFCPENKNRYDQHRIYTGNENLFHGSGTARDTGEWFEVDPSTVGQFVAHWKGIDLYEGDKVVVRGTRRHGNYETFIKHHGMGFILDSNKTYLTEYRWLPAVISTNGTIHDTPADGK